MKKKIILGLAAAGTVLAILPMLAAFEAHVINVTARIENALQVSAEKLNFGTVFPQEHLEKPVRVALSRSFLDEGRVDDVDYFIRQKPKCAVTTEDGQQMLNFPTATGHVNVNPETGDVMIDCGPAPDGMPADAIWGVLPSLCEYISKEGEDRNDGNTPSFHKPWTIVQDVNGKWSVKWLDTKGRLAKSDQDVEDNWVIDLAVPCFGGFCAQDWADFVHGINPQADSAEYTQPIGNEHKVFGCDLWIEVGGVSEKGSGDVNISNSNDFTIDGKSFAPPLASSVTASTTYYYSARALSGSSESIPTVQWKVTVEGPVGLAVGDVHIDEVGWKDIGPNPDSITIFHYPMTLVGGKLVAIGSCASPDPEHGNGCAVDDFDVDPSDDFTNVDSVHFDVSAPDGVYTIKRQLVDTGIGDPLSNELTVAVVTK